MGCCKSKKTPSAARVDGKTAVVTGCEEGVGLEVVRELVKRGCRVIMACLDVDTAEAAATEIRRETFGVAGVGTVVVVRLDLSSFASVRQCAAELLRTETGINLLINNAVLFPCRKTLTEDGIELQFAVNHLGHFLLTLLLLPRILKSTPARVINLTSDVHSEGRINFEDLNSEKSYDKNKAFYQSKLANILFTAELSRRLQEQSKCLAGKCPTTSQPQPEIMPEVTTYSVHPGHLASEYLAHVPDDCIYRPCCRCIFETTNLTAREASRTVIHCAVDEDVVRATGLYFTDCSVARASSRARDPVTAQRLWEESVKMTGLQDFDPFTASDRAPSAQPD